MLSLNLRLNYKESKTKKAAYDYQVSNSFNDTTNRHDV
jgi:hypothetical protein